MSEEHNRTISELRNRHAFMTSPTVVDIEGRLQASELGYGWAWWKDGSGEPWLTINIHGGHELRIEQHQFEILGTYNFEHWRGVPGYQAYVDLDLNTITASIDLFPNDTRTFEQIGFNKVDDGDPEVDEWRRQPSRRLVFSSRDSADSVAIESTYLNPQLKLMTRFAHHDFVLVIRPADVANSELAREKLVRVANALFFELDFHTNIFVRLARSRGDGLGRSRKAHKADHSLSYPSRSYDPRAIAIYNHARSFTSSTLLPNRLAAYLAYYQVLEFFMPKYAQADAVAKLQKDLLDPTFDAQDAVQVSRLLTEMLASKRRETELKQLKATLQYCLTREQLEKYLEDHIEDAEHLAGPGISDVRRISRTDSSGIIDQCADRVYDIRCRIVHSKDSDLTGRPGPLLPLSDEATLLDADIELVEFLARHVLKKSGIDMPL